MRKVLVLTVIAIAFALSAGWAIAAENDARGPACADIVDTDWFYSPDGTTATVIIHLDVASCPYVTYKLVVLDSLTNQTLVIDDSAPGDGVSLNELTGEDVVTVEATVPEGQRDGTICLYATTSIGNHVFDRAPDATCVELIPGGSAGGLGFG